MKQKLVTFLVKPITQINIISVDHEDLLSPYLTEGWLIKSFQIESNKLTVLFEMEDSFTRFKQA